jgi:hypothetical protein
MDPADYDQVLSDPQQVRDRIFGSKIVIGLEQCMLFSTWGVKTCMLTLFWRLTKNLRLHVYVKIVAVYVAVGFVVIMVTYYAVYCRPFSQYWAMPVQDMQCATYQRYSITQAVFNLSSDARNPDPFVDQSSDEDDEEGAAGLHYEPRRVHHRRGNPEQGIQFCVAADNHVPNLVHPRGEHSDLCRQPSVHVASPAKSLQSRSDTARERRKSCAGRTAKQGLHIEIF